MSIDNFIELYKVGQVAVFKKATFKTISFLILFYIKQECLEKCLKPNVRFWNGLKFNDKNMKYTFIKGKNILL